MHRINLRQCFSKAILVMAVLCAFSMPPALAESIHPAAKVRPHPYPVHLSAAQAQRLGR